MKHDPEKHRRRSIRLAGYDYARPGAYFVTICTRQRECLFRDLVGNEMVSNEAGQMVLYWWNELKIKYQTAITDAFIVMPNHVHGIIQIIEPNQSPKIDVGADRRVCPDLHVCPDLPVAPDPHLAPKSNKHDGFRKQGGHTQGGHTGPPLPQMVQWFKTMTTNAYIHGVKQNGWPAFPGKLWQRNYYERVIRNHDELQRIREYVVNNPQKWAVDRENSGNSQTRG